MRAKIRDAKQERKRLHEQAKAIKERAESAGRDLTPEELAERSRLLDAAWEQQHEIEAMEDDFQMSQAIQEDEDREEIEQRSRGRATDHDNAGDLSEVRRRLSPDWTVAESPIVVGDGERNHPIHTDQYAGAFNRWLLMEEGRPDRRVLAFGECNKEGELIRDMHALIRTDDDVRGGHLVAPVQFVNELIKDLDDELIIRQIARTFTVRRAKSLGAPKRTARANTFAWGTEISAPAKDDSWRVGMRELFPHHMTGEIDVSRDFLGAGIIGGEEIVRGEMSQDSGELQEDGFLLGNGAGQPLGVFTASTEGISTARDVSTGNTSTNVTPDGLKKAKWSLKSGYRRGPGINWVAHRDFFEKVDTFKDGQGRYFWQESLQAGEPDRLLGYPARESERAPNTFTTGQYVAILGNFRRGYWIATALDMSIERDESLERRNNQVAFIARMRVDGMPVIEEAFARVKLA